MSHTTYGYTREKLGFEPDREERRLAHYAGVQPHNNGYANGHANNGHYYAKEDPNGGIYEENLSKFKGGLVNLGLSSFMLGISTIFMSSCS